MLTRGRCRGEQNVCLAGDLQDPVERLVPTEMSRATLDQETQGSVPPRASAGHQSVCARTLRDLCQKLGNDVQDEAKD